MATSANAHLVDTSIKKNKVSLKPIDFKTISYDAFIGVLGRRGMGKTTGYKSLLKYMAQGSCPNFVVFCGSTHNIAEWKEVLPGSFVGLWDEHHLRHIIQEVSARFTELTEAWVAAGNLVHEFVLPFEERLHVILDDLGFDGKAYNNEIIDDLANNGRHKGIGLSMLCQYYTQLPRDTRSMLDYILLTTTIDEVTVKAIHNGFMSTAMSYDNFRKVLAYLTKHKGNLMVISNKANDMTDVSQRIYTRQNKLEKMKFTCVSPSMKAYHDAHWISDIAMQRIRLHNKLLVHASPEMEAQLQKLDQKEPQGAVEKRIRALKVPLFHSTFTVKDQRMGGHVTFEMEVH